MVHAPIWFEHLSNRVSYNATNLHTAWNSSTQHINTHCPPWASDAIDTLRSGAATTAAFLRTHPAGRALSYGLATNAALFVAASYFPAIQSIGLISRVVTTASACGLGALAGWHPNFACSTAASLGVCLLIFPPQMVLLGALGCASAVLVAVLVTHLEREEAAESSVENEETTALPSLDSDVGSQTSAAALSTMDAAPASDVSLSSDHDVPQFKRRLRTKLMSLTGKFATEYREVGLAKLSLLPDQPVYESDHALHRWLRKFDALVDTRDTIEIDKASRKQFIAALATKFQAITNNENIKERCQRAISWQMRSGSYGIDKSFADGTIICIAGTSGSGKTAIANLLGDAIGTHVSLMLPNIATKILAGAEAVYKDSSPSDIAQKMIANPHKYVLVHLDEIDQIKPEAQAALLSLLEPENNFVDQYFKVPLNKSRLIIICTMKADSPSTTLAPDIWNRLRDCVVRTSPLSTQALKDLAIKQLANRIESLQLEKDAHAIDLEGMAEELCLSLRDDAPGRSLTVCLKELVHILGTEEDMETLCPTLDASYVARKLHKSWAMGFNAPIAPEHGRAASPTTIEKASIVTLYARVDKRLIEEEGFAAKPIRWALPLDTNWLMRAVFTGTKLEVHMRHAAGESTTYALDFDIIRPTARLKALSANEFIKETSVPERRANLPRRSTQIDAQFLTQEDLADLAFSVSDEHAVLVVPLCIRNRAYANMDSFADAHEAIYEACQSGPLDTMHMVLSGYERPTKHAEFYLRRGVIAGTAESSFSFIGE